MPTTTSLKSLKSLKDINIDKDKKETTLRRSFRILSNHQNQRWSKHWITNPIGTKVKSERKISFTSLSDSGGIPIKKRTNKKEISTPYSALFQDLNSV